MTEKLTGQAAMQKVFSKAYKYAKNGKTRIVQIAVAGKEITLAHIIGVSDKSVYKNLGLDIGTNAGKDFTGSSIGIINITPPESTVIAADIAVKSADVFIGFLDRFSGTLILTGSRTEVRTSVDEIVKYFREDLKYKTCSVTER
ncbi:BMC domain-containing protein [Clostridium sp. P21]|uniref:BMC domain-containing protein n=1 Tax=Clostridium muellerianum TaxID=2716538 RepID=A0A7Y0EGD3_9CLOT|nr:BMC domain-containing protein [Clostridium muellerianum]NMM62979.1 BMC domain-containing protein [Clostridium muellerianum]